MTDAQETGGGNAVLAVVFGLPGPKTWAASEALQEIARIARRDCSAVEVNAMQDWQAANSKSHSVIAVSQYPSPDLSEHIASSGVPVLVAVDSQLDAVAMLVADAHSDVAAIRAVSASASCLSALLRQDAADIQISNAASLDTFIVDIAEGIGADVGGEELTRVEELVAKLCALNDTPSPRPQFREPEGILHKLAADILPRDQDPALGEGSRVNWPASLFFLGDAPDTAMHGPVDLGGPARCVLYGPYMHLPAGTWHASVIVGLTGCSGTLSFTLEAVCRDVIAKGRFHCRGSGLFRTHLDFVHRQPDVPIELRLFLDAGEIHGAITRFGVDLQSSAQLRSDMAS